jgi:predicted RNase H-like HicB family nuclease
MKEFTLLVTQEKNGISIGEVIELPGCHSQGRTLKILEKRIQEASELYLDAQYENQKRLNIVTSQKK